MCIGKYGMSKPCNACTQAILDRGIKNIHYMSNGKYTSERI